MAPYFLPSPWNINVSQSQITFVPFIASIISQDPDFQLQIFDASFVLAYQALVFNLSVTGYHATTAIKLEIVYLIFAQGGDYFIESSPDVTIIPDEDYFIGVIGVKIGNIQPIAAIASQKYFKATSKLLNFKNKHKHASSFNGLNSIAWYEAFDVIGLTIKSDVVNFYQGTTSPAATTQTNSFYNSPTTYSSAQKYQKSKIQRFNTNTSNSDENSSELQTRWSDFFKDYDECIDGHEISILSSVYLIVANKEPIVKLTQTLYQKIMTLQNHFQQNRIATFQRLTSGKIKQRSELVLVQMIKTMTQQQYKITKEYFQNVPKFILCHKQAFIKSCIYCAEDEVFIGSKKKCYSNSNSLSDIYPQLVGTIQS